MISEWYAKAFCCEDISRIENYDLAIADKNCKWNVHHRLECVNGVFTSRKELIAKGLYYNRPANELIFLTPSDHQRLHIKNPNTLMKISKALRKPRDGMKRRWQDQEYQQRHRAGMKRAWQDPLIKQKLHDTKIGRHWYTNGETNRFVYECPGEGWHLGRTYHKRS